MNEKAKIEKALVVISPDLIRPDRPKDSVLMRRAISLARATGCEIELYHVCHDSELEDSLFQSREELDHERKRFTDEQATRVAELAAHLRRESVKVSHETRWDYPRVDAILRKIGQSNPDLVMKHSRDPDYVLGLVSNTDWELVRRSPADVWLVNEKVDDIDRILAAIGTRDISAPEVTTSNDHDLLRMADRLGEAFGADLYPVNAYQLPTTPGVVAGMSGASAVPVVEQKEVRETVVKKHKGMIRALSNYFDIPIDNVRVREGQPDQVIPDVAEKVSADLIVLGARSIGRMQRVVNQVTVEPVISRTDCDILVVREPAAPDIPKSETQPFYGIPTVSLEHAITDPEDAFDSPQEVVSLDEVSIDLRRRILQAWEFDIRAGMAEENEGGRVEDIGVSDLDAIVSARALLDMKAENAGDEYPTLEKRSA